MYAGEHGGGEADALTNLVFAEALSQSTFGGFIITVLVHTDMASPHLHHAGSRRRRRAACRRDRRDEDHRGRRSPSPARARTWPASARRRSVGRRRRVGPQRHQDVHHQRRARRPVLRRRQDRRGPARDVDVHRREGNARLSRRPRAREDRLALVRHRRAGVRQLPHPGRQPAGRGEQRLLLGDEELPDRAHRARRDGGRPLHAGAQADARPRAQRQAFGAHAVRQAGRSPASRHARRQGARGALLHVPLRLARDAGARHRAGGVDAEGADRRARQRGGRRAASSSTAAWATCARRRSSACGATRACWPSAAARPR